MSSTLPDLSPWSWLLLLAAALALAALGRELLQVLGARYRGAPRSVTTGGGSPSGTSGPIPRVIWTYWHSPELPPLVARCIDNWRRHAPGHEIRLLHAATVADHLPGLRIPARWAELPAYRQSDWLRIQLIARHGGLWMDATTILTRPLDWVEQAQQQHAAEFVGFYIDMYSADPQHPMVENWFLAAVPGSRFVRDWADELDAAVIDGDEDQYLAQLDASGELPRVVQRMPAHGHRYLIMHLAGSRIQQRAGAAYRLHLLRAEDEAFVFHAALGWRKHHLFLRLGVLPCPRALPRLIKLRGNDRRVFEKLVARGWLARGSALGVLLELHRAG